MFPNHDTIDLGKDPLRCQPTAPPMGDDDESNQNLNKLNRESDVPTPPDILMNIPNPETGKEHAKDKLIPTKADPDSQPQGPWKTKNLGELVNDEADPLNLKKKRQRKIKRALGWAFWITCAPLALVINCIRDSPLDPDDPMDWNNDPLRPWHYKINLER